MRSRIGTNQSIDTGVTQLSNANGLTNKDDGIVVTMMNNDREVDNRF
jgi:hypothetical protein